MHLFLALFTVWIILSAQGEIFFLVAGAVTCAISVAFTLRMVGLQTTRVPLYFRTKMFFYMLWLLKEIVISSLTLTRIVLSPKMNIAPVLVNVPAGQRTEQGIAMMANSITMTPGTVSVGVSKDKILVHALHEDMVAGMGMESQMNKKIQEVEAC